MIFNMIKKWRPQKTHFIVIVLALCINPLFGQGFLVRGTVTDSSDGSTLPGVNIVEKGTTTGTVTDVDGNYSLTVSGPDAVLRFTYIGYLEEEVPVQGRANISISMAINIAMLSEMVVIGYGAQRREDLTGSIAVVNADDINRLNVVSFDRALQGRAAGVHVTTTSGRPGADVSIKIRGIGSISRSSEPLFVVDGVALSQSAINSINPADIETIQVLKDASATAIYGTRGANGVIVITTKRGETGAPSLNYSSSLTLSQVPRVHNVLNADQYSEFTRATWTAYSQRQNIPDNQNLYLTNYSPEARRHFNNYDTSTDWQDAVSRTGIGQNHNLSIRGGGEQSNYFMSLNYYDEEGILVNTAMDRLGLRVNSDFQVSDRIKIGQSASLSRINYIYESHQINFQPWSGILIASPLMPIYDPDAPGGFAGPTDTLTAGNERTNVLAEQMLNDNTSLVNRIIANAYAEVNILKGLNYTLRVGGEYGNAHAIQWSPRYTLGNMKLRDNDVSRLTEASYSDQMWQLGNYLEYANQFGSHNLTAVIGHERTLMQNWNLLSGGFNIEFEDLNVIDQIQTGQRIGGSRSQERLQSVLFRGIYDYQGTYLLTASIRQDGSSKFAPTKRIGYFPSFSAGWRLSDNFMQDMDFVDMVKLRFGWGQTGNSNIPRYQYLDLIDPYIHSRYNFGDNQDLHLGGASITFQSSPMIQWEATEMTNFGLDAHLFRTKVEFTAEYYIKNQNNMLVQKPISAIFGKRVNYGPGWPTVGAWMNLAQVQNRGFEFNLLYREWDNEFKYTIGANFSTLKNTIVDLGVNEFTSEGGLNIARNGHTIGSFYGFIAERILQEEDFLQDDDGNLITNAQGNYILLHATQEAGTSPGDIKFKDLNGDGVIDDRDRTIIGKPLPDFIYGLDIQVEYKGWDMGVFLNGMHNMQVFNMLYSQTGMATDFTGKDENKLVDVLDYWTPENRSNTQTRPYVIDPNRNHRPSTWFIEDASFLRVRNVQIGFTLPRNWVDRVGFSRVRLYAASNNVFTITGYRGYDPEIGSRSPLEGVGIDYGVYPVPRNFIFGVQADI